MRNFCKEEEDTKEKDKELTDEEVFAIIYYLFEGRDK